MQKKDQDKNLPEFLHSINNCPTFSIQVRNTHEKHNPIHRNSPYPDRTSLYSHPIKCHRKTIEQNRQKIYSRTWILPNSQDRSQYMSMRFLDCEEICSKKNEKNPYSSAPRNSLTEEDHTRENNRNSHQAFHRRNE